MTILCATDFSQAAAGALAVAADIARARSERLVVWHAVQPELAEPAASYLESLRNAAATQLESDAQPIRASGVAVEVEAFLGSMVDELPARMPSDTTLLVAGARGHARGTHWLIGTVVERIARIVTVPMLVVRDAPALRSWLSGARTLDVMLATDLTPVSDFALRRAAFLRDLGPCNAELLYVEYPPGEYARFGVTGPICIHRPNVVIEDILAHELAKRAESVRLGGSVTTRIAKTLGNAGDMIALQAGHTKASLVVVGSHQRGPAARIWHGSIAHAVLHSAETNVLLIPFHTADEEVRALESPALTTVVVATDLSPCGNAAIAWALRIAPPEARVMILTVVEREAEANDARSALERIRTALPPRDAERTDLDVVVGDGVAATICATAERLAADALVVGRHGRSRISQLFVGSVAGEVLLRSRRPVLVVPSS